MIMAIILIFIIDDTYLKITGASLFATYTSNIIIAAFFTSVWLILFVVFNRKITSAGQIMLKTMSAPYRMAALGVGCALYALILIHALIK
jgi:hypothetical protein